MRDIESREDLMHIMQSFYDKLLADSGISYIFTEVAKINLEEHFPVLVDFWDSMLFGTQKYKANAMQPHLEMAKKSPFSKAHFDTWLTYLFASIDEGFEGEIAHTMKSRAQNIASLMALKVEAE